MGVLKPFSKWLAIAVLETGKPLKTVSALWYRAGPCTPELWRMLKPRKAEKRIATRIRMRLFISEACSGLVCSCTPRRRYRNSVRRLEPNDVLDRTRHTAAKPIELICRRGCITAIKAHLTRNNSMRTIEFPNTTRRPSAILFCRKSVPCFELGLAQ